MTTTSSPATSPADAPSTVVTLNQIAVGDCGHIAGFDGLNGEATRLMEMGLLVGGAIRVTRVAPLGDPIEIRVMGYRLSLRKSMARHILVRLAESRA